MPNFSEVALLPNRDVNVVNYKMCRLDRLGGQVALLTAIVSIFRETATCQVEVKMVQVGVRLANMQRIILRH
jgi:hypothetical protein